MERRRWADLSTGQRASVTVLTAVQVGLAVTAWVDLARRDAAQVRGHRSVWAVLITISYVGPIAYFVGGRTPAR